MQRFLYTLFLMLSIYRISRRFCQLNLFGTLRRLAFQVPGLCHNIHRSVLKLRKQDGNVFPDDSHNHKEHGKHKADQHHNGGVAAWSACPGKERIHHHRQAQKGGKHPGIDAQLKGHIGEAQDGVDGKGKKLF